MNEDNAAFNIAVSTTAVFVDQPNNTTSKMAFGEDEKLGKESLVIYDVRREERWKTTKISICDLAGI